MRKTVAFLSLVAILAACSQQPAIDCAYGGGKPVKGLDVVAVQTASDQGLTLRTVCFQNNTGKPVTIDAVETSSFTLEGTEIWSFQPSTTEDRKDWVLPVGKGFYQRNFLGMNGSDYGGGIPMASIWNKDAWPSAPRSCSTVGTT